MRVLQNMLITHKITLPETSGDNITFRLFIALQEMHSMLCLSFWCLHLQDPQLTFIFCPTFHPSSGMKISPPINLLTELNRFTLGVGAVDHPCISAYLQKVSLSVLHNLLQMCLRDFSHKRIKQIFFFQLRHIPMKNWRPHNFWSAGVCSWFRD